MTPTAVSVPLLCLLGFAGWTLLLLGGIAAIRGVLVLSGRARSTSFPVDTAHGGPAYRRLLRAHLNCVENLPIFASIVLVATAVGANSPTLDTAAQVVLAARIAQSTVHLISVSEAAITVRFTFFIAQIGAMGVMIGAIVRAAIPGL